MSLDDQLEVTAAALASGCSIDQINRAGRAHKVTMPDDKTAAILDRLTTAFNVADSYTFAHGDGGDFDDAFEVLDSIKDCGAREATEVVDMLAGLAALLSDASDEIVRLSAECAGLRARSGK